MDRSANTKWICAVGIVLIIASAVFGVCIDDEPDIFQCKRLKPGVTESDNECCNIMKARDYKYEHFFPISKRDNGKIELTFKVQGNGDADLLFSEHFSPKDFDLVHEIVLGGGANMNSWIRKWLGNDTDRILSEKEEGRVLPDELREFWVQIEGNTVQVGRKGKAAFLASNNATDLPIKYYSIAGYGGVTVLWYLPCIVENDFSW
ncbi:uncharacterized protein LOC135841456 [Planococcus citri]|uniref:uncharacterized protein LOC135841456 n=1 Tax=Planococcus citri TaxID=170843 RepID=UPI0031F7A9D8